MIKIFLDKDFSNLSGGEKSRIILGKVLLENPDVLLLDEPYQSSWHWYHWMVRRIYKKL